MKRTYELRSTPSDSKFRIDYKARLNPQQHAVVTAGSGPLLVIAGAGTGKTHTLTHRVARLIESGVSPQRILLLTFTNRAARAMVGRVGELLHSGFSGVVGGTFHSVANRILREHAAALGYPDNFGIMDSEDAASLIRQCAKEVDRPRPELRFPKPSTLLSLHSYARNTGRTEEDVLLERFPHFEPHREAIDRALLLYTQRKLEFGLMDFDDLLQNWQRLLVENENVAALLTQRFSHILVDEYQDTNRMQSDIVDRMASAHRNLMVVGDDAQSIYRFRGAEYENILAFEERYPDAERFLLETNYRSTPEILALANRSIGHNRRQFEKRLTSAQSPGAPPVLVDCEDEDQQAMFVAQRISELRDEGVELDHIAVLYRAHRDSMALQLELSRRDIPFVVRSGQRFFEQRHIKDVLSFLRYLENPRDELAFSRIAMLCDGIGPVSAGRIFLHLGAFETVRDGLCSPELLRVVPRNARPSFEHVRDVLIELDRPMLRADAAASIEMVRERFYEEYARRSYDKFQNRLSELQTLSDYASQEGEVSKFLESLSLAGVLSGKDLTPSSSADDEAALVLSTIHQSKGLEFHAVFLLWLSEQRFPTKRAALEEGGLEEERRLFHVAVTRAQRELYMSRPMLSWDREQGRIVLRRSRFIEELEGGPALWERWALRHA